MDIQKALIEFYDFVEIAKLETNDIALLLEKQNNDTRAFDRLINRVLHMYNLDLRSNPEKTIETNEGFRPFGYYVE